MYEDPVIVQFFNRQYTPSVLLSCFCISFCLERGEGKRITQLLFKKKKPLTLLPKLSQAGEIVFPFPFLICLNLHTIRSTITHVTKFCVLIRVNFVIFRALEPGQQVKHSNSPLPSVG